VVHELGIRRGLIDIAEVQEQRRMRRRQLVRDRLAWRLVARTVPQSVGFCSIDETLPFSSATAILTAADEVDPYWTRSVPVPSLYLAVGHVKS
jgi:hypothetical protein